MQMYFVWFQYLGPPPFRRYATLYAVRLSANECVSTFRCFSERGAIVQKNYEFLLLLLLIFEHTKRMCCPVNEIYSFYRTYLWLELK